jgi:NAD-dependent SIR2 family protein deacetylase
MREPPEIPEENMPESPVLNLHNSLRQAKERWAVFLGAGASYDYGIPTMREIATILRRMIRDNKTEHGVSEPTLTLLKTLCKNGMERPENWNIEDLLTRLYQLLDATGDTNAGFAPVKAVAEVEELSTETIKSASDELTAFMARMCDLSSRHHVKHGTGSVAYLSDFLLAMASFGKPASKLVRIFTTNIDVCIEAAMARLSQRTRAERRPDLVLVDGFESGVLPTFNLNCYRRNADSGGERCVVYYWKLHGSVDWTYSHAIGQADAKELLDYSDQSIIVRRVDTPLWDNLVDCGALSATQPHRDRSIVIFPTPAKYSQTYTVPYMDLFEAFRRTLEEVELLICVGTSFPDQHIRSAIRSFVERDNTLLFLVDPSSSTENLKSLFGASRAVQAVIPMGFAKFVQEFRALDAGDRTAKMTEGKA